MKRNRWIKGLNNPNNRCLMNPPTVIRVLDDDFPKSLIPEIASFFKHIHSKLPPGKNLYKEIYDCPTWFPLQYQREMSRMIEIAKEIQPKTICEIGADKGGSLYHWCHSIPTVRRIIGCEIRGTPYSHLFEENFPDIEFYWTQDSRSQLSIMGTAQYLGQEPIDILFLDGEKCFFCEDFDTYLPMMHPNGIIFMHDIVDSPMKEAFNRLSNRGYRTEIIRDIGDYHRYLARGTPPQTSYEHWLNYWKGTSCGVGVIYLDGSISPKEDRILTESKN